MAQEFQWKGFEIGQPLDTLEVQVTPEEVAGRASAVGDPGGWVVARDESGTYVSPLFLAYDVLNPALRPRYPHPPCLQMHAKEECEFFRPVRLGSTVRVQTRVADHYFRRGKEYVAVEALYTDEEGRKLARMKMTVALLPR